MPLHGMAEVPDHLRELLLEAAYTAAGRVFDAALAEEAEFLVLSGDLLHPPRTGPRAAVPQRAVRPAGRTADFRRTGRPAASIRPRSGRGDPPARQCPPLHARRIPELIHQHNGLPSARLCCTAATAIERCGPSDFTPDPAGLYTIAVAHEDGRDSRPWGLQGIDDRALGGRPDHLSTLFSSVPQMAHYAGSPQGRRPDEAGVHGCTLGPSSREPAIENSLDARATRSAGMAYWVVVEEATTHGDLESLLRQRIHALAEKHAEHGPAAVRGAWPAAGC